MNKKIRIVVILLSTVLTFAAFAGCGRDSGGGQVDKTKSQLYIGTYGGGYGTSYLEDLKERFEEYAKDTEFEEGKKGVQVWYQEDKDKYEASTFVKTIKYDPNELIYLSGNKTSDMVRDNTIVDITDILTQPLTEFGETKTPVEKLKGKQKDYFLQSDGKYYSVPFAESSLGVIYDIDVFEENQLYLAKNGAPSETLQAGGSFNGYSWVGATGERSAGPDGDYSTKYDNGLPATLDEFQKLIDRMYSKSINSIIWTGQYADTYTSFLPRAFHLNYHGVEETSIVNDGGGQNGRETRIITSFSGGQPVIEKQVVGLDNIKTVAKQAGRYYGLKMFEIMLKSNTVSDYAIQELSHVRTQEKFLVSNHRYGETPIAFMIDGTWWENEAAEAGTFKDNMTEFGLGRQDRRFGFYVMPNATFADLENRIAANSDDDPNNDIKNTILGGGGSVVINANASAEKIRIAKAFLRFSLTDVSLSRFTVNTSLPAPYEYEITPSDKEKMSYFASNYWEIFSKSDVYYDYRTESLINNTALDNIENPLLYYWSLKENGTVYTRFPTEVIFNNVNAIDYFNGIYRNLG